MHARIFGIVFGPVGNFKSLRAKRSPIDLQGIDIDLFGEFHHDPRRVHRVQNFAPPHGFHIAVGQVTATHKAVVVLGGAAINRFSQETASPLVLVGGPEASAIVATDTIPVVIIRKRSIRESKQRVTAIDQRRRHVVIAARRIPNREVRRHHIFFIDDDTRMQVIDLDDILGGKSDGTKRKPR